MLLTSLSVAIASPKTDAIDAALEAIRESHNIPALGVAVVDEGSAVYAAGFGQGDGNESPQISEHTLFRVASITKLFTAQAIVQLVEQDKIRLEDKVGRYISQFEGDELEIIDLITHTSGLSDSVKPTSRSKGRSFDDYLGESLENNRAARGEEFEYADLNFNILGEVVEVVSGVSYLDYVQSNILSKVGIERSGFKRVIGGPEPAVSGHYNYGFIVNAPERPYDTSFAPSEGLISSVVDLSLWVQAVLSQDERILSKPSYDDMFTPRRKTIWGEIQMGLAWQLYPAGDQFVAQHAGTISGFNSLLITYPEQRRAIIILGNADVVPRWEIAGVINAILDDQEFSLPASSQGRYKFYVIAAGVFLITFVGLLSSRIRRGFKTVRLK